jgi:RNA polymerase sigma factor FliA
MPVEAAAHQPNVARSVQRIVGMLLTASDPQTASAEVVAALADPSGPTPPALTAEEAAERLLRRRAAQPDRLRAAWEAVSDDVAFTDAVAFANNSGLRGEDLASAVIHHESKFHLGLVWLEANRMASNFDGRSPEDLAGWGWLGLRAALRLYEPSRGHRFSTYACFRISGAIRDGVRDENPVPKRLITMQRKVSAAQESLSIELGRVPQLHEVAAHLDITFEKLSTLLPRLSSASSLDEMEATASERGGSVAGMVDDSDPADAALDAARSDAVRDALNLLDEPDRETVRLLLYEGKTMTEARRITGMSDRELRRRLAAGSDLLRDLLADWSPLAAHR